MKKMPQKRRSRGLCRWAAVCAAGMMLMMYGITGLAAQKGTNHVDNVNVRTQASAESDRVCKLPANTELNIVEETTGSDGNVWYSVTFTLDGQERSGWIRSDMVTVTETEDPSEGENPEEGGSEGGAPVPAGSYSIQEPVEEYPASDSLSETGIQVGDQNYRAWVVDAGLTGGRELYLVWAVDAGGSQGWFYYDPQDGTFQREMGQFTGKGSGESGGMIESLQQELANRKDETAKSLSQRLYVIIGLGVLSGILLIIVIVLAVKLRNSEYEYYDDDEDDDDEDDDDDDDYDDYEEKPKKRGLFRRRAKEEEEEEEPEASDFDDLLVAVRKKWAEEEEMENSGTSGREKEEEEPEEEEAEEEIFSTKKLPKIDMSAVLEVEEEAAKKQQKKKQQTKPAKPEPQEEEEIDDIDDMDIEILDIDDLDL